MEVSLGLNTTASLELMMRRRRLVVRARCEGLGGGLDNTKGQETTSVAVLRGLSGRLTLTLCLN